MTPAKLLEQRNRGATSASALHRSGLPSRAPQPTAPAEDGPLDPSTASLLALLLGLCLEIDERTTSPDEQPLSALVLPLCEQLDDSGAVRALLVDGVRQACELIETGALTRDR